MAFDTTDQLLLAALEPAVRRVKTRDRIRELGWIAGSLSAAFGVHLILLATNLPQDIALAARTTCMGVAMVVLGRCAWKFLRRPSMHAVAAELDEKSGLDDVLKSAYWFASRGSPSAWESALLTRATRTVRGIDLVQVLPVRMSGGAARAAVLGALVLAAGLLAGRTDVQRAVMPEVEVLFGRGHGITSVEPSPNSIDDDSNASPPDSVAAAGDGPSPNPGSSADRRPDGAASDPDVEAEAGSTGPRGSEGPRGGHIRAREAAGESEPAAPGEGGALQQALELSAALARGAVERVQSFLGRASPQTKRADLGADLAEARSGAGQGVARQDAQQEHTTMNEMSQAMQQLTPSLDGDRPAPARSTTEPPSQGGGGKANITGGADGMRVNLDQIGDDGDDTPPDAPLSEPGTLHGKRTERLAVTLDRIMDTARGTQTAAGASEGFYAASQAQAARVELSPVADTARGRSEAALSGSTVSAAQRNAVKRYFLLEHGREK
ncbi:MAG: hypothetical protein JNL33_05125 [Betaproteobacteria bacterium]|nr:hypothetical protein [Betaproteobacteria bacterium]